MRDKDTEVLRRFVERQLAAWPEARGRWADLSRVETRELEAGGHTLIVQHNPARMVSTGARTDSRSLSERPCFLCAANRPREQEALPLAGGFEALLNPFPILPTHLTIASTTHRPQRVAEAWPEIGRALSALPTLMVFYNGPRCGASAPDHLHLQAGARGVVPLQREWSRLRGETEEIAHEGGEATLAVVHGLWCAAYVVRSRSQAAADALFARLCRALPVAGGDEEPMMNIVAWREEGETVSVVIPRRRHRPACYGTGEGQRMVSPGALDMAGLSITPRASDFQTITADEALALLREVSL